MTKQEVLDYFELKELPQGVQKSNSHCPVLVQRTTGIKDYAVAKKGGIKLDSNFRSAIVSIIEFYPIMIDDSGEFNREEAIAFLLSKKQSRAAVLKSTDEELKQRLIRFNRRF